MHNASRVCLPSLTSTRRILSPLRRERSFSSTVTFENSEIPQQAPNSDLLAAGAVWLGEA
jgi:hypothetical protein